MLTNILVLCSIGAALAAGILIGDRSVTTGAESGPLTEEEARVERKRRAKRLNERLKLIATFTNGLGVAYFATSVFAPMSRADDGSITQKQALAAVVVLTMLHIIGQIGLHFWKSED